MNGIRNTYLYVCGSHRLLNIRRMYTSAGLIGLNMCASGVLICSTVSFSILGDM